ncbi:E3 ubiquitin- ligase RNF4-like isoform X2 [Lecanosticta acicola]|uniref:E3 ubiquitin- ligase RNF4-like isoform X2 n=1 Tax=Lecanosticta acicola TaxID=111012 RepID=A0AAI8W0Q0_9PEZI|nr:E3 ubiquitin- ligase RNF4-like isoform X2 [Lecanosticta acicola]
MDDTLPTREVFFETGLAQAPSNGNDCPICSDPLEDAVSLPCHPTHVFCRTCIKQWLNAPTKNTCPQCRKKLFIPAADREYLPADYSDRRQLIDRALEVSGIRRLPASRRAMDFTELHTFDLGRPRWDQLSDRGDEAGDFLAASLGSDENGSRIINHTPDGEPTAVQGRGWMDLSLAFPRVVAMANLLPAVAEAAHRPYSDEEQRLFRIIVAEFGRILRIQYAADPEVLDVVLAPGSNWAMTLDVNLGREPAIVQSGFFWIRGPDIVKLLEFTAYWAWKDMQSRRLVEREGRRKRRVTFSRCFLN